MDFSQILSAMKNNPMFNAFKMSKHPRQQMLQMLENNAGDNPLAKNVLDLAQSGNDKQIETIARNILSEQGINPDDVYRQFSGFFK